MVIDEKTMAQIVQLGSQYLIPVAALLRALYAGMRGRFPEGLSQIALASVFAGLSAVVGHKDLDLQSLIATALGNAVFVGGLLAFTMSYLLRMRFRSFLLDAIVGAIIGLITWGVWVFLLDNPWPWYFSPIFMAAGAAGYVVLRTLLRQIAKLVRLATMFIVAGVFAVALGGGILLVQRVLTGLAVQ
jgi:hypothetical protein